MGVCGLQSQCQVSTNQLHTPDHLRTDDAILMWIWIREHVDDQKRTLRMEPVGVSPYHAHRLSLRPSLRAA